MANIELDLFKVLIPAIDNNMKDLYEAAGADGKKDIKKDLWNLNRYISSINGNRKTQELAVLKVNEYYNKNWNVLGGTNHVQLQWQLLCVAGHVGKSSMHPWIGLKKKSDGSTKIVKLLARIYPHRKIDELELLAKISTKKEIKELAVQHGYEKIDI